MEKKETPGERGGKHTIWDELIGAISNGEKKESSERI